MTKKTWKFTRFKAVLLACSLNFIFCLSLNEQGLALLRLKERILIDPFGALTNWIEIDGEVNPCSSSWSGVECLDGNVVALNLQDCCLGGALAPDLRDLSYIKNINLRNNCFAGSIPNGIGELEDLEVLDLGYNNFSGSLPSDIGSNPSLVILLLDNNELLSGLSLKAHDFQMLSEFQVDENQLSYANKETTCIISCSRLCLLDNNELLGGLSPEAHNFQMLSEFQVDENQLSYANKETACKGRSTTRTFTETENAYHGRQLEETVSDAEDAKERRLELSVGHYYNPYATIKKPNASFLLPTTPSKNENPPASAPSAESFPTLIKNSSSKHHQVAIIAGSIGGSLFFMGFIFVIYLCRTNKVATVRPWATGLSGQLQKAFVTGVPKLKRLELEAACEDFSNVIVSSPIGTLYKGTLSSGVEITVASVAMTSSKDWTENLELLFRTKIDTLSRVNHKNFANLLGYCVEEEPFTRMIVFEYAPNGTLFEHLHIKESEHLDWATRMRIAMGMAYCLDYTHQLNPPVFQNNLTSSSVYLTEDNAAKISDLSFWNQIPTDDEEASSKTLLNATPIVEQVQVQDQESNVYSFGVLLFEIITGRLPYSVHNGLSHDWASDYLPKEGSIKEMLDPTLDSYLEEQLEQVHEVIKSCVNPDPSLRPGMREVSARLRDITGITPDGAYPKLSPLWWAELEILSIDVV